MKMLRRSLALLAAPLLLATALRAGGFPQEFLVPAQRECTPCAWFQVMGAGTAAPAGHSGVLHLATQTFGSALYGGWLTFTPQGTFLTYIGGTTSTVEILDPSGAPLANVRGAVHLASAFVVLAAPGGSILAVTLYSGIVLWDEGRAYLLLVGGPPTTYELVDGSGASIPGVKGVARLAGDIYDTDPGIPVVATMFSGALLYTGAKTYLNLVGGGISTSEVLFSGSPIAAVRGVTAMGGSTASGMLDAAAFLWTPSRALLLLVGGGVSVSEVLDPSGASIDKTWAITRQSPLYTGGGFFSGAATIVTDAEEWLVLVGGGISTTEMLRPGGGSISAHVNQTPANTLLHQASNLSEIFATWNPPGGPGMRGTVIGSVQ